MSERERGRSIKEVQGLHPVFEYLLFNKADTKVHPLLKYLATSIYHVEGEKFQFHPLWDYFINYSKKANGALHPLCQLMLANFDEEQQPRLHPIMRLLCD